MYLLCKFVFVSGCDLPKVSKVVESPLLTSRLGRGGVARADLLSHWKWKWMNVGGLIREDARACVSSSEPVAFDTHLAYCPTYAHRSSTLESPSPHHLQRYARACFLSIKWLASLRTTYAQWLHPRIYVITCKVFTEKAPKAESMRKVCENLWDWVFLFSFF